MTITSANQILIIGEANIVTDMLGERLAIVSGTNPKIYTDKVCVGIRGHTLILDEYKPLQEPKIKKQKPYWRKNERW